ncbi:MAG: hypothetical protein M3Y66_02535 [Actinomycetota bacterium]|nr:hypothetical protein [Actinomycetota bacterium]
MALAASCPRCTTPLSGEGVSFSCADHGSVVPLWRSASADYSTFADVMVRTTGMPTYLPWPLSPGWTIADFGCVAKPGGPALATVTTTAGASALDGDVQVTIVSEEPGVGLGARCAGMRRADPGEAVGAGPASVRLRVDSHPVSMWVVPSSDGDDVLARSVFVGEAEGRWLWLVMRPASAALLLSDEWLLADAGGFGPEALELPFGGAPPVW